MLKSLSFKTQPNIIIIGLFLFFLFSCDNKEKSINEFGLSMWIEDRNNFHDIITFFEKNKCDQAEMLLNNFKTSQFKNQAYLPLARCYASDNEKSLKYLTKAIKVGYHIKLIDSILFKDVWNDIKAIYPKLNQEYWSQQDTIYFKEIERLVYLDRKVRYDRPTDSDDFTEERKQDSISTKFLIDYCQNHGYPEVFNPSHFSEFRSIDPSILAIHAEDIYKREILDCAIEAARSEKISWLTPIIICKSFYVAGKQEGTVNPIFMLYFDDDFNLDYEKSLLQLYSIQELYGRDMPSNITLRPSLSNNLDKAIVEKQLSQIKSALVNEFSFNEDQIIIDLIPSKENLQDDFTGSYLYTISAWRL